MYSGGVESNFHTTIKCNSHARGAQKKKMRKATADNDTLSTQPVLQVINKLNS